MDFLHNDCHHRRKRGGRLGSLATRRQIQEISSELESRGYTIVGGGGKLPDTTHPKLSPSVPYSSLPTT